MLFDFSGVKAMISLAAATTIQKIADSRIAIIISYRLISIVGNKKATLTTVVFHISLF